MEVKVTLNCEVKYNLKSLNAYMTPSKRITQTYHMKFLKAKLLKKMVL